jgi:hypothetical protein
VDLLPAKREKIEGLQGQSIDPGLQRGVVPSRHAARRVVAEFLSDRPFQQEQECQRSRGAEILDRSDAHDVIERVGHLFRGTPGP